VIPALLLAAAAPLDRDGTREAARRELSKPQYHRDDPSLTARLLRAIGRFVVDLFQRAASVGPGGRLGGVLLVVVVVLVLVAVRLRAGPLARRSAVPTPLLGGQLRTPQDYRTAAAAAAAAGDFATALRDQLRAIAREAEVRGLLEPRPGRTADELVREMHAARPEGIGGLPATVAAFDHVWYGGRRAVRADYDLALAADRALSEAPRSAPSLAAGSASSGR
jgi:hypothetical protein